MSWTFRVLSLVHIRKSCDEKFRVSSPWRASKSFGMEASKGSSQDLKVLRDGGLGMLVRGLQSPLGWEAPMFLFQGSGSSQDLKVLRDGGPGDACEGPSKSPGMGGSDVLVSGFRIIPGPQSPSGWRSWRCL